MDYHEPIPKGVGSLSLSRLKAFYEKRGYDTEATEEAMMTLGQLEGELGQKGMTLDDAPLEAIKAHIRGMVQRGENSIPRLLAMARHYYIMDRHDIYLYFTKLLGGLGVIDSIKARAERYGGAKVAGRVFDHLVERPLGTPPEDMPDFTVDLMESMQCHMKPALYRKVLAGNNHGIPEEAMQEEKAYYEKADSMEDYLEGRHERKIAELQEHCDQNKVWFEQEITQGVVDYVASNQEILSAVKEGDTLYVTKIPFDTENFVKASDPTMKSYFACHCPFAREAILQGKAIPRDWCYCSAGFAKYPFEVILGRELEVELLASALDGDPICRFAISLPTSP